MQLRNIGYSYYCYIITLGLASFGTVSLPGLRPASWPSPQRDPAGRHMMLWNKSKTQTRNMAQHTQVQAAQGIISGTKASGGQSCCYGMGSCHLQGCVQPSRFLHRTRVAHAELKVVRQEDTLLRILQRNGQLLHEVSLRDAGACKRGVRVH